ncbi:MAG: nitroreductase [Chloroflexi bacterium]|nr:nitroreductase [Chloroflexota bacterium]MCI0579265.1 nitroreductase [Chloroflexota bacterium]MCI0643476.1 nitroreductase [Chloroflexota bacterium]MCI0728055.1 nitroreductase [Chloroflexota bacterium]
MDLSLLFKHSLRDGLILSVLATVVIIGSLYANAEMWLNDYPPDVKARFGPISDRAKKQRTWLAAGFFLVIIAVLAFSVVQLKQVMGTLTFGAVALHLFIVLMLFNLVDFLFIDLLFAGIIQPRFLILPGTEGMAGYKDYGFQVKNFIKGAVGISLASPLLAGVVLLINALLS